MKINIIILNIPLTILLITGLTCFSQDGYKLVIDYQYDEANGFSDNGLACVKKGDKYGAINRQGEVVIDFIYDEFHPFAENGLARVKQGEKYGFIDASGKKVIECKYETATDFSDNGLAAVNSLKPIKTKAGFIDVNGNEIHTGLFDEIGKARENLFPVKRNGKWGVFDINNELIIDYAYDWLGLSKGELIIVKKDDLYGFINLKGELLVECIYDHATQFLMHNNYIKVEKNNKVGLINSNTGNIVMDCIYDEVYTKYEIDVITASRHGIWQVFNRKGEVIFGRKVEEVPRYNYGNLLPIKVEEKWGYINKKGKVIIDFIYDEASDFRNSKPAKVKRSNKVYFINEQGKKVSDYYEEANSFYDDSSTEVKNNGKWGIIDESGNYIIECQIVADEISIIFNTDLIWAKKDGKYGILNKWGEIIINYQFEEWLFYKPTNYLPVKKNGKQGLLDLNNLNRGLIIECKYDRVFAINENLVSVKDNGYWGIVNLKENNSPSIVYDEINFDSQVEVIRVKRNGKWGIIDTNEKVIQDFKYENLSNFSKNGIATFQIGNEENNIGYIDKYENIVINFQFKEGEVFSKDRAVVSKDNKDYYINSQGNRITDKDFYNASNFASTGLAVVGIGDIYNHSYGIINTAGEFVVEPKYEYLYEEYNGKLFKGKDPKLGWIYIDTNGNFIFKSEYYRTSYSTFGSDGYAPVNNGEYMLNGKRVRPPFGFINTKGELKIDLTYKYAFPFYDGLAAVMGDNGKYGCINLDNEIVLDFEFGPVKRFWKDDLTPVCKNEKWGYIKLKNIKDDAIDEIKPVYTSWLEKGKYESTSEYIRRTSNSNKTKKIQELLNASLSKLAPKYCDWNKRTSEYDADNMVFKISIEGIEPMYIKVPKAEAMEFDQALNKLDFRNIKYGLTNKDKILINYANVVNPKNGKIYTCSTNQKLILKKTFIGYDMDDDQFEILIKGDKVISSNSVLQIKEGGSDVDLNIPVSSTKRKNTLALIIGNEDYASNQSGLSVNSDVPFAKQDAKTFYEYCNKTLGIPQENIKLLLNSKYIEINNEINRIQKLSSKIDGAEIIFYYAGHGMPDEQTQKPHLIPVDVSPTNLEYGIRLEDLYASLSMYSKRTIVFLDACFSGGAREHGLLTTTRGLLPTGPVAPLNGGVLVFSATAKNQTALGYKEKAHGMFTYNLLKILQTNKGDITLGELSKRLEQQTSISSLRVNNKEQDPKTMASPELGDDWINEKL